MNLDCFSQSENPFYEQLAFDFYKESILKVFPVEKKITVFKSLNYDSSEHITYLPSDGLKMSVPKERDSIKILEYKKYWKSFEDMRLDLDLKNIDRKQFKIKKSNRGYFPKLFVHYPKTYRDRIFVVVHEKYQNSGKYYTVEFNQQGKIIDWCTSEYTSVTF
ncbi:hypothetical protein GCM10011343_03140 [Flavobacterium orientale]|uniref:Uncharacterized protein n=1 Tax=Flavobacterium orientale TaxID=1756020 RepID=A0A917D9W0_9FLAO|nr:hypothetical protein GCM10011343_03140 [Flavobacterium orientale]